MLKALFAMIFGRLSACEAALSELSARMSKLEPSRPKVLLSGKPTIQR